MAKVTVTCMFCKSEGKKPFQSVWGTDQGQRAMMMHVRLMHGVEMAELSYDPSEIR